MRRTYAQLVGTVLNRLLNNRALVHKVWELVEQAKQGGRKEGRSVAILATTAVKEWLTLLTTLNSFVCFQAHQQPIMTVPVAGKIQPTFVAVFKFVGFKMRFEL